MGRDFEGAEIIGQRTEEAIVQEIEQNLRGDADYRGLEPLDEKALAIELMDQSVRLDSEEELDEYLNDVQGLRTADIVLRAGQNKRKADTFSEQISVNLQFENQGFLDIYVQADVELGVEKAGFSFLGYDDDAVEAYRVAAPMLVFDLEDYGGFTASYRDDQTVIESIWSEDSDDVKLVYDALQSSDALYNGTVIEGEKQDEWIISDQGSKDLMEMN